MACEQAHIWPAELYRCCYGNYSNNVRVQWKSFTAFLRCVLSRAIERGTVSRHFTNDLLNTRRLFIHHKRSIYYQNTQAIWLTACVNFTIDVTGVSTSSSYIEFSAINSHCHAHQTLLSTVLQVGARGNSPISNGTLRTAHTSRHDGVRAANMSNFRHFSTSLAPSFSNTRDSLNFLSVHSCSQNLPLISCMSA